ncbi:HNH endonuclease signature motif containing protein [Allopontixanthobacter sediminis]|uniref:HNH endonuclease n=1 Tax=Allopontixanthobacter sediminis TaxID=1689985 RepID=A0A845AXI2_9SPHN|nr:HNH endonuclease signature motif containing protein [Allopontixanthobacter sediminis]MXP42960.1 HNH endonuclease [Allopontixanthobacter sediminis]
MKGRAIRYSSEEMAWLEKNRAMVISAYHAAFIAKFPRDDVSLINLHSLRKRKGWKTGRTGHFEAGKAPMNKGKKCAPGTGGLHPNARKTQFKKGERTGIAQKNYKPVGYERISIDGYRERKVNDDLPFKDRWQLVQRIEWEAANGPIPDGYALKCLDGNRLNCAPSNWEPVKRSVLARLNGGRWRKTLAYDDAPAELKPLVMATAKLKDRIQEVRP